jgi:uridylate kinase
MTYVLSIGGSLIIPPSGIDVQFLKSLRKFVINRHDKGDRLIIVTGGGSVARQYVKSLATIENITEDDQDWIGIHATRLNAHLVRTILRDVAHPEIVSNPNKIMKVKSRVLVAGGYRPGWSTDYVAVLLAKKYKTKTLINLSNIDYVYEADPYLFPRAKVIKDINWQDFREIVGDEWRPGLNAPFDPIASKLAQSLKLQVAVLNGNKMSNVHKFLDKQKYQGTIIHP